MESDALVLFQQTTRSRGSRRFKAYRVTAFEPVGEFLSRFDTYLRRNRFPQSVDRPHWLDAAGPVFEGTLAQAAEAFQPFAAFHTFVVTSRAVHPFLVVPMAVDVVPTLASGLRVAVYDAADCPDGEPAADAEPVRVIDRDAYDRPLSGVAGPDGLLEWWHLFGLRTGRRLARRTDGSGDEDDPPTAYADHGDRVVAVQLRSRRPFRRLSDHSVFVNYGADALGIDDDADDNRWGEEADESDETDWSADPDERLTRVLRETATARYRYARHLWAVRGGERDPRFADDPDAFAEEREAAAARFLQDLIESYDGALAPFSTGSYGALLRKETATRADTFDLSGRLDVDREEVVRRVDRVDPTYDPEYDHAQR